MPFITLESVDCVQFKIDTEVAKFSGTIKTMLEEGNVDDEKDAVVPLPNVSSDILRHIVEWANHHKGDPTIDGDENNETGTDDISEWDSKFLEKLDKGTLFELISAANYLDAKGLMAVSCKTVRDMVKGKTTKEIRTQFNVKSDFTYAEEEQYAVEDSDADMS